MKPRVQRHTTYLLWTKIAASRTLVTYEEAVESVKPVGLGWKLVEDRNSGGDRILVFERDLFKKPVRGASRFRGRMR